MKISSLPYGFMMRSVKERGLPALLEWVDFCAEHGLDGVEISEHWLQPLHWVEVLALIERIRKVGVEVSSLLAHNAMNCPAGESRDKAVQQMKRYAEMAQRLGAPSLRIESGAWADYECYRMSRQQAIDNTVATIEQCLPMVAEKNVCLAIENHPGYLVRFADVLVQFLERIDSKYLVLNLDIGSLFRDGQRPEDFLRHEIVIKRTTSLHLKTIRFEPDPEVGRWNQSVSFEESHIDYRTIFTTLKRAGFDGWITYESHESVDFEGIAAGGRFARRLWAEI